jgi:long-chain fatty acid transport protein
MTLHHSQNLAAACLVLTLVATPAFAAGIALREGSTDWIANAFAGRTAKAYDAGTVLGNPAGLARLDHSEIDVSGSFIAPYSSFSGSNMDGFGQLTPGSQGGNPLEKLGVPAALAAWSASPDLKFGMAFSIPFGQRVTYPHDFVGRYQSLVSNASDLQWSLVAAYRISPHVSVGGGPVVNLLSTRLTEAVNLGPLRARFGDPTADFSGSHVGAGFVLGAMYEFDDSLRFGVTYQSRIHHAISGVQSISVPAPLSLASPSLAAILAGNAGPASTELTLPDSVSLGVYAQIDERWAVMADLQWTNWSLLRTLSIVPANQAPVTVLQEDWRDTWFFAAGVNFRVHDRLLL